MTPCRSFRSVLFRAAEGEASPKEALQVARHVPDCTACRIVQARQIRLATMLDGLADSIPVGESFVEQVMRSIPHGPPPARKSAPWWTRRASKLAGFGGALLLGGAVALRLLLALAAGRLLPELPRLGIPDTEHLLEVLAGVARFVWMILDRIGDNLTPDLPTLQWCARIGLTAFLPGAAALVTFSTLLVLLARARSRN